MSSQSPLLFLFCFLVVGLILQKNNQQFLRWHLIDPVYMFVKQLTSVWSVVCCLGTDVAGHEVSDLGRWLLDGEYLLARFTLALFFFFPSQDSSRSFCSVRYIFHLFWKLVHFRKLELVSFWGPSIRCNIRCWFVTNWQALCFVISWEDSKLFFVVGVSLKVNSCSHFDFFYMASWHNAFD